MRNLLLKEQNTIFKQAINMITTEFKQRICQAIITDRLNYPSDAKQAIALDLNSAQLSRINKGELEQVVSDAKWLTIARRLSVNLNASEIWNAAQTETFLYITTQLEMCQKESISGLLCDIADIGKTFSAKIYAKQNKNAVLIDCSQVKSKQKLVRGIAKEFGVGNTGRYADVYADLVYYLQSVSNPLVILDEAGDLDYPAFLELKALWNATEGACGWFMMGADGLKEKMRSNLERKKVGYTEIFSRFGKSYQRVSPEGTDALEDFLKLQTALVAKANNSEGSIQKLYGKTEGSLRRLKVEIKKQKAQ